MFDNFRIPLQQNKHLEKLTKEFSEAKQAQKELEMLMEILEITVDEKNYGDKTVIWILINKKDKLAGVTFKEVLRLAKWNSADD